MLTWKCHDSVMDGGLHQAARFRNCTTVVPTATISRNNQPMAADKTKPLTTSNVGSVFAAIHKTLGALPCWHRWTVTLSSCWIRWGTSSQYIRLFRVESFSWMWCRRRDKWISDVKGRSSCSVSLCCVHTARRQILPMADDFDSTWCS